MTDSVQRTWDGLEIAIDSVHRTWDGLEIATDSPTGATVVVRRPAPDGPEVLLLHRAHDGPDFAGDWAWTAPAGCRQPGESVYAGASRELAEEAGLTDLPVWAVDVTRPAPGGGGWALLAADLVTDASVELVDPEHDRFEWLRAQEAIERSRPEMVASALARACSVPLVSMAFRRMTETDLSSVARWQRAPHAAPWFDGHLATDEAVRQRYLPRLADDSPVRMWVVEIDGRPSGYVQDYRVADQPDYAVKAQDPDAIGFDYVIGESDVVGSGLGTRMIWEFCRDVLHRDYPAARRFVASPSHRNAASLRALEKCGFTQGLWIDVPAAPGKEPDTEIVCTLDVRHWLGPARDQPANTPGSPAVPPA